MGCKRWKSLVTVSGTCVLMVVMSLFRSSPSTEKVVGRNDTLDRKETKLPNNQSSKKTEKKSTAQGKVDYSHFTKDGENITFFVIGDWGLATKYRVGVAHAMELVATSRGCDFIISTGDNFYPAGLAVPKSLRKRQTRRKYIQKFLRDHWRSIYNRPGIRNVTWYVTSGNHDHGFSHDKRHMNQIGVYPGPPNWYYPALSYKFTATASNVKASFTTMDTENLTRRLWGFEAQKQTFLKNIFNMDKSGWKVAWTHVAPYGASTMYNIDYIMHRELVHRFDYCGLDLHFAGHDHNLQHISRKNVSYFVSGAGSKEPYKYSNKAAKRLGFVGAKSLAFFNKPGFISVELSQTVANISFIGLEAKILYNTIVKKKSKT